MPDAIEINQFSKFYGDVHAVNKVNLAIKAGEIFGFLGLNGAGKTTTIRALLGMIRPTTGNLHMLGHTITPNNDVLWRQVGYLVEGASAYPNLTVWENLEMARRLYGVSSDQVIQSVIKKLKLGEFTNRKAGTLSTGNMQRLGLARAILHRPTLLILDEPSNGLDPAGIVEIREMLRELAQEEGVTIFMSSHILSEVEQLATRIGIIHHGELIEELDKKHLRELTQQQLSIKVRDLEQGFVLLKDAGYAVMKDEENGSLLLSDLSAVEAPERISALLAAHDAPPVELMVKRQRLEEHFMQLTGVSV